jgi:branched-subunit amino acid aminotransferase/4-amino-4-deoxychorismate lyase
MQGLVTNVFIIDAKGRLITAAAGDVLEGSMRSLVIHACQVLSLSLSLSLSLLSLLSLSIETN